MRQLMRAVLVWAMVACSAAAAPKLKDGQVYISGLVRENKGSTLGVMTQERDYVVRITDKTVIGLTGYKQVVDAQKKTVSWTVLISAVDGSNKNDVMTVPLPPQHEIVGGVTPRSKCVVPFKADVLKPYATEIHIIGTKVSETTIEAVRIEAQWVGDPLKREDPKLKRYLFIGDSISFNYNKALREALKGKVNLHHPPRNCGGIGVEHRWLGAFDELNRAWDVISINGGHWNSNDTKPKYQAKLRQALDTLEGTGAKIIWVTTCPVDYGYNHPEMPVNQGFDLREKYSPARHAFKGDLKGRVPGRMKLQNQWAIEVLTDYPQVFLCDQWQVVKNGEHTVYKKWWLNKNVHFSGHETVPIARALARRVMDALGRAKEPIHPLSVHGVPEGFPEIPETKPKGKRQVS
jgi:hypothetical protein